MNVEQLCTVQRVLCCVTVAEKWMYVAPKCWYFRLLKRVCYLNLPAARQQRSPQHRQLVPIYGSIFTSQWCTVLNTVTGVTPSNGHADRFCGAQLLHSWRWGEFCSSREKSASPLIPQTAPSPWHLFSDYLVMGRATGSRHTTDSSTRSRVLDLNFN